MFFILWVSQCRWNEMPIIYRHDLDVWLILMAYRLGLWLPVHHSTISRKGQSWHDDCEFMDESLYVYNCMYIIVYIYMHIYIFIYVQNILYSVSKSLAKDVNDWLSLKAPKSLLVSFNLFFSSPTWGECEVAVLSACVSPVMEKTENGLVSYLDCFYNTSIMSRKPIFGAPHLGPRHPAT